MEFSIDFNTQKLYALMEKKGYDTTRVRNFALPDRYMEHAPRGDLLEEAGLTAASFAEGAIEELQATTKRLIKSVGGKSA